MISIKPDIVMFQASGKFVPGDFATLDVTLPGYPMPLRQIPASSFDMGTISMAFKALTYFDKMAGSPPREIAVVHSRFIDFMVISSSARDFYHNGPLAAMNAHLDLHVMAIRNRSLLTGILPELWGLQQMSQEVGRLKK